MNDVHRFDFGKCSYFPPFCKINACLGTKTWSPVVCNGMLPYPRFLHTSCVYKNSIHVFGGTDGTSVYGDLLRFDCGKAAYFYKEINLMVFFSETSTWDEISGEPPSPSPRCSHASVVFQDSMYILGGETQEINVIDAYEFFFGMFLRVIPSSPAC